MSSKEKGVKKTKKSRTFKGYIKKLVKMEDCDIAIGKKPLRVLDHMVSDVISRVTKQSSDMVNAKRGKKNKVLGYRVVASSFRLLFRDKVLQEEMNNYAQQAIENFSKEKKKKKTVM